MLTKLCDRQVQHALQGACMRGSTHLESSQAEGVLQPHAQANGALANLAALAQPAQANTGGATRDARRRTCGMVLQCMVPYTYSVRYHAGLFDQALERISMTQVQCPGMTPHEYDGTNMQQNVLRSRNGMLAWHGVPTLAA